jgi:osmotically-inducible protein OsmY
MLRRPAGLLILLLVAPPLVAACGSTRIVNTAPDDATITARVKTVLLNDPQIGATKIDVSTSKGVVTVSGTVKSQAEEARAVQLAHQVAGVRDVRSTLQVTGG